MKESGCVGSEDEGILELLLEEHLISVLLLLLVVLVKEAKAPGGLFLEHNPVEKDDDLIVVLGKNGPRVPADSRVLLDNILLVVVQD